MSAEAEALMIWLPQIFETIAYAKPDDVRFRQSDNLVKF